MPRNRELLDSDDDFRPMTPEEEAAAERQWERSRKRREWEHYHPGEPCPKAELE